MKKTSTTAERLATLMRQRGIKQAEILDLCKPFCDKYGVTLNSSGLSQYVTGKNIPRQDKLTVLAQALGVDEAWLMGYDDDEPVFAALNEDETELVETFRNLSRKDKHRLMAYLYELGGDVNESTNSD